MKKTVIMMALLLATGLSTMQAQTKEDMQAAKERCEKLTKLLDNKPKSTSIPDVDQYVDWVNTAAATSMANSEQLRNLYYRSIGETEDGVTDVTVKKPTLEELTQLSTTIAAQAVSMKEAVSSAQKAATAAKDAKGRATVKAAKALAYTKDAYPILVEETEAQGKAIAAMIETAKTAKNL